MPAKNKTGPEGKGPRTGRQMGDCEGANQTGRGFGFYGRGRGFGRRQWCRFSEPINLTKEEEKKILEAEQREIEQRLKELK